MFFVLDHEPACTRSQLELPPNSVLLGRCVWLVRAGRPKPRLVHQIFFLSLQILARLSFSLTDSGAVWATTSGFGAPMAFWRKNSNFAETLNLFLHSFLATLNVKLTSAVCFTLAPKSAQMPQRLTPANRNTFDPTHVAVNSRQHPGHQTRT